MLKSRCQAGSQSYPRLRALLLAHSDCWDNSVPFGYRMGALFFCWLLDRWSQVLTTWPNLFTRITTLRLTEEHLLLLFVSCKGSNECVRPNHGNLPFDRLKLKLLGILITLAKSIQCCHIKNEPWEWQSIRIMDTTHTKGKSYNYMGMGLVTGVILEFCLLPVGISVIKKQ